MCAPAAVAEVKLLLLNLQHLLNSFRPHAARGELIAILQRQIELKEQLISEIDAACADAASAHQRDAPSNRRAGGWGAERLGV